jgi:hypothetical protein
MILSHTGVFSWRIFGRLSIVVLDPLLLKTFNHMQQTPMKLQVSLGAELKSWIKIEIRLFF